jgi:hypothetical protein
MRTNLDLETVVALCSGFLPLSSLAALRTSSRGMKEVLAENEPEFHTLQISKTTLDASPNSPSYQVFRLYGQQLQNLTVSAVHCAGSDRSYGGVSSFQPALRGG